MAAHSFVTTPAGFGVAMGVKYFVFEQPTNHVELTKAAT